MQTAYLWNGTGYIAAAANAAAFARFCSADLPPMAALYNSATGLGTQQRIYMNGEENGAEGRAVGHIVTGADAGKSYELPALGKFSWENSVASPAMSNKTIVAGMDDASVGGQVYMYIGTKTNAGLDIDKAGLTNGNLYGVKVTGMISESSGSTPAVGTRFTLAGLGDVKGMTGASIDAASVTAGITSFLRPEDGAWDPSNPRDFYFATTNSFTAPSRLWRLRFDDALNPEAGGTIEAVLDGTEGQKMLDNLTIDKYGHILLVEDVGGNEHNGKVWQYTIASDELRLVAQHDPARFQSGGANFLTNDEEASGIIDVQDVLGAGWFLTVDQAHYSTGIPSDIVEGGQLLAMYNPDTYNSLQILLPLKLIAFEGALAGNKTQLKWSTSNEVNTSHFDIERSSNGINFHRIEMVNAKGNGNNTYTAVDAQPQTGKNYYRLKMVDKDGMFEYSSTILINVSKDGSIEFVMYPNPVRDQLVISYSGVTGPVNLVIFNQQGQQVISKQIATATTTISIGHLPKGIYVVQVMANGIKEESKLIKY